MIHPKLDSLEVRVNTIYERGTNYAPVHFTVWATTENGKKFYYQVQMKAMTSPRPQPFQTYTLFIHVHVNGEAHFLGTVDGLDAAGVLRKLALIETGIFTVEVHQAAHGVTVDRKERVWNKTIEWHVMELARRNPRSLWETVATTDNEADARDMQRELISARQMRPDIVVLVIGEMWYDCLTTNRKGGLIRNVSKWFPYTIQEAIEGWFQAADQLAGETRAQCDFATDRLLL
jgi:hypothetical protein